jgi:hypothetical protein
MKMTYYKMETTIKKKTVDIDDDNLDMDSIRKQAELHAHLHGWDDVIEADEQDWAQEFKEDDNILAKNPLYY